MLPSLTPHPCSICVSTTCILKKTNYIVWSCHTDKEKWKKKNISSIAQHNLHPYPTVTDPNLCSGSPDLNLSLVLQNGRLVENSWTGPHRKEDEVWALLSVSASVCDQRPSCFPHDWILLHSENRSMCWVQRLRRKREPRWFSSGAEEKWRGRVRLLQL